MFTITIHAFQMDIICHLMKNIILMFLIIIHVFQMGHYLHVKEILFNVLIRIQCIHNGHYWGGGIL